jgi:hypothetical protein
MIRIRRDELPCGESEGGEYSGALTMAIPGTRRRRANTKRAATAQILEVFIGKQRREQPQDSIFANNPFVDGFFEWMGSREGQQCIEVRDVLWDLLEDVQLDAKQRQLIWPDAERLDLEQSIQRIQKLYPDLPRDEVEEFVLNWIERWVADHLRKAKASKKRKRTRHS